MIKNMLFSLGILAVLLLAASGHLKENALWGLMLFPLFFIGEPWYKSLKRRKPALLHKENLN
ncbi:hypothetical protein AC739_09500 [Planococcus glaciei]|uniref:Uncharacterized protein n=1 Tax=Planococcus glaciei TaxID=459472 RepID=A0A7H8QB71_9BACL|nr:hypothetical protein [Planococcus glaciei]ETP69567.1 hypothetical protein G159_06210 [Planococcus glaciei CHR43]KOF10567.1 hypothetical protein AC739_09500 [Planococcus glaciei]QDY45877.1 hypothetical protein FK545_11840 [Planococcus glaciei]QKX51120.1 hypothetical protein HF394_11255 [Planococcus glaciei]